MQLNFSSRSAFVWVLMTVGIFQNSWSAPADIDLPATITRDATSVTMAVPIFSQTVVLRVPAGWKSVHEPRISQDLNSLYTLELVPQDQTKENWKEMITVQGLRNLAKDPQGTPTSFLNIVAYGLKKICGDEFIFQPMGDMKIDSYDAHAAIIGCARLQTEWLGAKVGQSEISLFLAIKGANDFYVVKKAVRGDAFTKNDSPITPHNAANFMRALLPIRICEQSNPQSECQQPAAVAAPYK